MPRSRLETRRVHDNAETAAVRHMRETYPREWFIEFGRALAVLPADLAWTSAKLRARRRAAAVLRSRHVAAWVEAYETALTTARRTSGWTDGRRRTLTDEVYTVSCSHCGAVPGVRCRRRGGEPSHPHAARRAAVA